MDTARLASPSTKFALRLVAWSLAIFGVLRLPWVAAHVLLPATALQAAAGAALIGPSSLPIEATLACSGADALALCLAAILAYPARWRMRGIGCAAGAVAILALNTIRIGTLGRAARSPRLFHILHVFVWPAVLTVAIAALVFAWMRIVERQQAADRPEPPSDNNSVLNWPQTRRFALLSACFLLLFSFSSPLYLDSARVLAVANLVARTAAALLSLVGVTAVASAGILATPRGSFLVTQECIATPLIPVYLAGVIVYARNWGGRAAGLAAAIPIFLTIGIARLLVVAVPGGLHGPPEFFIHAFSQLMVGAAMICGFAIWRYGIGTAALVRALAGIGVAVAFVSVLGPHYTHAIL
jgi:exosortase/archaeosortase family protein